VLENRQVMKSLFAHLFASARIRPVTNYPLKLLDMLEHLAPEHATRPARSFAFAGRLQTRLTSNIRSSRSKWASNLWRAAICLFTTASW